jgi:hypothetical protein
MAAPAKINNQPLVAMHNPTVLPLLAVDGEDQILPILKLQAVDGEDNQVLSIVQLQLAVDGEDHLPNRILRLFLSQRCCSFPE